MLINFMIRILFLGNFLSRRNFTILYKEKKREIDELFLGRNCVCMNGSLINFDVRFSVIFSFVCNPLMCTKRNINQTNL